MSDRRGQRRLHQGSFSQRRWLIVLFYKCEAKWVCLGTFRACFLSISTIRRRRVHQLLGLETPQSVIYHLHHQSWLLSELVICKTQTRKNKPEMFSQRLTHGGVGLSAAGQPRWLPRGTTALTMVTVTVCPACEASSPPWCRSISVSSPWTTNLLGVKYSSKAEHVCTAAVRKSARSGNTCITFRFRCGAL